MNNPFGTIPMSTKIKNEQVEVMLEAFKRSMAKVPDETTAMEAALDALNELDDNTLKHFISSVVVK